MFVLRTALFVLVAALCTPLLAGCAPIGFAYTHLNADPAPGPPRPASNVEVYAAAPPPRPHTDVQIITAYNGSDPDTLVAALRAEAGRLGCDGIFVSHVDALRGKATCMRYAVP